MKPTRAVEVVTNAALRDLRAAVLPLRSLGWPVEVSLVASEPHEDHFFTVRAEFRISSPCAIPDEARARDIAA